MVRVYPFQFIVISQEILSLVWPQAHLWISGVANQGAKTMVNGKDVVGE